MTVQKLAKEWVIKSDNYLISAKALFDNTDPKQLEIITYLMKQALEFIIKAVYSINNKRIIKTSNLKTLSENIFKSYANIPNCELILKISVIADNTDNLILEEKEVYNYLKLIEEIIICIKRNYLNDLNLNN